MTFMCELKSTLKIASVERSIKIAMSGLALVNEATEAINKTKTESWKDLLQDAMSNANDPNMWEVIQGLSSTPDANSPNEAMSHNGWTITDVKSKANVFMNYYARVSKLICHNPTLKPTNSSRNVLKHHLLMMIAVLHF